MRNTLVGTLSSYDPTHWRVFARTTSGDIEMNTQGFASPLNWCSYLYPEGWRPGIYPCLQTPVFQVPPAFEVLNMALPRGNYVFYFGVDDNVDGKPDVT